MTDYVDLHVHTSISDGAVTPKDVVELAYKKSLKAIAITDHDITDGIAMAMEASKKYPIEIIPGLEISVDYTSRYGHKEFHVLGFFIDWFNKDLLNGLEFVRLGRENRNKKILRKLNELGVEITQGELDETAKEGILGRIHFAYLLYKKKYVESIQDAFTKYIRTGGPAYFDRDRLEMKEAIDIIRKAGGIPVLAHPKDIREKEEKKVEDIIKDLKNMGLMGIEAYYWEHSQSDVDKYKKIADKHNLLISGGSDFHGLYRGNVSIGTGLGNLKIPYELVVRMKERINF